MDDLSPKMKMLFILEKILDDCKASEEKRLIIRVLFSNMFYAIESLEKGEQLK